MNQQEGNTQGLRVNHLWIGWTLFKRDFIGSFCSPIIYIAVTVTCLVSTFFVVNYLDTLSKVSVLVSVDPLSVPRFFAVAFMALFIGVLCSMSITGEKEHRTLEVLFYGPVTPYSLILAKFGYGIALFLLALTLFTVYLLVESTLTNLALGTTSLKAIGISFFLVWPMISFSLLLSAACKRVRNVVLLFIGIFLAFTGIQIVYNFLLGIPPESISLFLLYVRETLAILLKALRWISPFSYIVRATTNMNSGFSMSIGGMIFCAVLYSLFLLTMTIFVLKKRGVIYG